MPFVRVGEWLSRHPYVLPIAILIIGGAFRFYNLNWDSGYQLHPDERSNYMVVTGSNGPGPLSWPTSWSQFLNVSPCTNVPHCSSSPLDPHSFNYGSLPYYLLAFIAGFLGILGQHIPLLSSWAAFDTYGGMPGLGRALSGCLDLVAVGLVFLIARRVFGYWTGVLAMALTACTVLDIQMSHFYTVDTLVTPLALATLLAAVHIVQTDNRRAFVLAGIAFGAALATKTTALMLLVPLGASAVLASWASAPWSRTGSILQDLARHYARVAGALNRNLQWLLGTYVIAAVTFVVCEPYAVLDRQKLLSDIAEQSSILVTNTTGYGVPYMVQYAHTIPYVYQIQNMLFWTMGLPLGLAACLGVVFYLVRNVFRFRADQAVLLLWILPYFLFVGRFFAKFNRYMLPIMPVMTILGAAMLVLLATSLRGRVRKVGWTPLAVVLIVSFLYSLAYMNIYEHPNTRVAATAWIYSHIPAGSTIAVETPWDDTLPLPTSTMSPTRYRTIDLDMYADESNEAAVQAKIRNITSALTQANYIIMSSERMIRSIPRLPGFYPVATRYYDLLQSNGLNFQQELQFQEHPQLGPIVVHDYPADESFHVYDHPDVRIYKRVRTITPAQVTALLQSPPATMDYSERSLPVPVHPSSAIPSPDKRLMLSGAQWQKDANGPTYDQMFPIDGFAMKHPLLVWFLFLEIVGVLTFPLTFLLFRNFRDRGFVLGKTLGLLLIAYAVWILVSLGVATYDRGVILLICALLGVIAVEMYIHLWKSMLVFVRSSWRRLLVGEAVFLAGFAFFVLLRMWYPDLGHQFSPVSQSNVGAGRMGEKQMELAFLNAVVRSRVFPPYDPFFAHGYINYYYYGFFLVGTICKALQIAPNIGFNLAVATFFALLVGNIASVALTLTRRVVPAIAAAAFVGIFGNLNGMWQVLRGLMGVAALHSAVPFYGGVLDVLSGLQQVLFHGRTLPAFDYWESTRIVPPVGGPITEFPYFTYLFADLHPHLIAFPMTALALAFAINFVGPVARGRGMALWVVMAGLVLGAIAVTNPWDLPTYAVVLAAGALVNVYFVQRRRGVRALTAPVIWMFSTVVISTLCYLPFKLNYQTVFTTGVGLTRNITPDLLGNTMSASDMRDALVTPLRIFLEHFGFFLFALASYVALLLDGRLQTRKRLSRALEWLRFAIYYRDRTGRVWRAFRSSRRMLQPHPARIDPALVAGATVILLGLVVFQYFLLAFLFLFSACVVTVLWLERESLRNEQVLTLVIALVPLALAAGTQVFFVRDFLAGGSDFRMNTIFKFYNQAWVLLGLVAACAISYFIERDGSIFGTRTSTSTANGESRYKPLRRAPHASATPPAAAFRSYSTGLRTFLQFRRRRQPLLLAAGDGSVDMRSDSDRALQVGPGTLDDETHGELSSSVPESHSLAPDIPNSRTKLRGVRIPVLRRPWWTSALIALTLSCLVYTYAGAVSRETARKDWLPENSVPLTLDGMAFMKVAYPEDYDAISWLNANVAGAQVIAEADGTPQNVGTYYDWRSRVSQFTGLPDILSGIHEGEQRWSDEIDPTSLCSGLADPTDCLNTLHSRIYDINALYDSPKISEAWRVIRHYGVRYIYVGFSERQCTAVQCYSKAGLAKFDAMVGHGLQVAYRIGNTTIYEVTSQ